MEGAMMNGLWATGLVAMLGGIALFGRVESIGEFPSSSGSQLVASAEESPALVRSGISLGKPVPVTLGKPRPIPPSQAKSPGDTRVPTWFAVSNSKRPLIRAQSLEEITVTIPDLIDSKSDIT